jgi:hypothetical protein
MRKPPIAFILGICAFAAGSGLAWSDTALKYPPAPHGATVDDYPGMNVADPYR